MSSVEERRKKRELEDARKEGTLAPLLDPHDGQQINPHLPAFIIDTPWYLDPSADPNSKVPSLQHQRLQKDTLLVDEAGFQGYRKHATASVITTTKFRKGACENCGALDHQKKECVERPRKITAKMMGSSGQSIQTVDTLLSEQRKGFDAKRDRWNDYDPDHFSNVVETFKMKDEIQKQFELEMRMKRRQAEKEKEQLQTVVEEEKESFSLDELLSSSESSEEEEVNLEDVPGQKLDLKSRMTVRNLRLREDTAKYLYDLSEDSHQTYNPKSRSIIKPKNESTEQTVEPEITDPLLRDLISDKEFVRASTEAQTPLGENFCWQAEHRTAVFQKNLSDRNHVDSDENEEVIQVKISDELIALYGEQNYSSFSLPE